MRQKRYEDEQLKLLTQGDVKELSKFKKKTKLKMVEYGLNGSDNSAEFFENQINLISVEELAVIFGLAPQTIRNWIALGKIPHVKIGKKWFFLRRSVQEWLNQKEEPQWR